MMYNHDRYKQSKIKSNLNTNNIICKTCKSFEKAFLKSTAERKGKHYLDNL